MDRLTSMSVFAKVVETGSFAAAASILGLSSPMVGKHVRFLEERLGSQLIHRTTRRQNLTDVGRSYYEHCRSLIVQADAADAIARDQHGTPRGVLSVTMPVLFGRRCAAPILLGLAKTHPELELRLSFSDHHVDLITDGFDLSVRSGAVTEGAGLMIRRIGQQRMTVCASPDYLAKHGMPETIEAIEDHQGIVYSRSGRAKTWLFPEPQGTTGSVLPRTRLLFDDLEAIMDAALQGMGLAWLPCWLVRSNVRSGALVKVLPDTPGLAFDIQALWLQTPHMPLRLRVAIDALAAGLPGVLG